MMKSQEPSNRFFYKKAEHEVRKIRKVMMENLPPGCRFFLFGSRAAGPCSFNSDIDVAIEPGKNFNSRIIAVIQEIIEESWVPFKVDIVNLAKKRIKDKGKRIKLCKR